MLWMLMVWAMLLAGCTSDVPVAENPAAESMAAEATERAGTTTGAVATTMQLTKTTGTVDVSSSSEKSLPMIDNMRSYSGYQVETMEQSYTWIDLDSVKLAKLDAASESGIRKKEGRLEIFLNAGNIFFNVSEPLKESESLNIRTSTMVVGIRGTCGCPRACAHRKTVDDALHLLPGAEGNRQQSGCTYTEKPCLCR